MSTSYEEALKLVGTNQSTTNAAFKAAMDAQDALFAAEAQEEINSKIWHLGVIVLLIIGVSLLWKISKQMQLKSKAPDLPCDTPSHQNPTNSSRVAPTRLEAKPPLIATQAPPQATQKQQAKDLNAQPDSANAQPPNSTSEHPHSRYMRKD